MTSRLEKKKLERAMKSPRKKRGLEARELRKELKNTNNLRRYHDDSSNHGQGLGKTDREED
jgi:hypothetical protein